MSDNDGMIEYTRTEMGYTWALNQAKWAAKSHMRSYALYVPKDEPTVYKCVEAFKLKESDVAEGTTAITIRPNGEQHKTFG